MRFNNEHFDGVELRLETGFLLTNPKVKEALDVFKKSLEEAEFSRMLPSREKNIFEIENYMKKKDLLDQRKEEEREFNRKQIERNEALLRRDILPIKYKRHNLTPSYDTETIKIKDVEYQDIFTKRGYIKAHVQTAFKEFLSNTDEQGFKDFLEENRMYQGYGYVFRHGSAILTHTGFCSWRISIDQMFVEMYETGKRNTSQLYYRYFPVSKEKDQEIYYLTWKDNILKGEDITQGGSTSFRIYLRDYKIIRQEFIKINKND